MHLGHSAPAVLEVGPAVVRLLSGPQADPVPSAVADAALLGIDDTVVLVEDRPAEVEDLWASLIAGAVGRHRESVVIVHPSRWPPVRIARVCTVAGGITPRVTAVSRREWLSRHAGADVVVEIDSEFMTVSDRRSSTMVSRRDPAAPDAAVDAVLDAVVDAVVDAVAHDVGLPLRARDATVPVAIDAPHEADAALARELGDALRDRGLSSRRVGIEPNRRRSPLSRLAARRPLRVLIGSVALVPFAVAALIRLGGGPAAPTDRPLGADEGPPVVHIVEGRVVVEVPASWSVARITGGPGSRRVRVAAPDDPHLALHITQSFAPVGTLADTAESLRRAIGAQPPGVFVDVRPEDQVAGRRAVTYREVRPGRVIRWSVMLEGSTRISVGCESRPGAEAGIRAACEAAVRSARELRKTGAQGNGS